MFTFARSLAMSTSPACRVPPPVDGTREANGTSNGASEAASIGRDAALARPEVTGAAVRMRKAVWNSLLLVERAQYVENNVRLGLRMMMNWLRGPNM